MANNFTTIENMTVEINSKIQAWIKTLDLSWKDIAGTSEILVTLYKCKRVLDQLETLNKRHEVIDQRTGKSLGYLYDNEKIGNIMMSTGISVNFWIDGCEGNIRRLTNELII